MDLIRMNGRIVVAGPDTTASTAMRGTEPFVGCVLDERILA